MKPKPTESGGGSEFNVRRSRFKVRLQLALLLTSTGSALAQPIITRQPTNLSLSIGATAIFRVSATTTHSPMTYQWRHQDSPFLNATNASLTLSNIQLTDAGAYLVVVSDSIGTTNSAPALLDVDPTWTKITSDPLVTNSGYTATGSWVDYNNDGFPDLLLVRLKEPGPNPLYRNQDDGTFTRVTEPSLQTLLAVDGVYSWGDYDNDGYVDLFVPEGRGLGLKNLFTNSPVVSEWGVYDLPVWVDTVNSGWQDLFIVSDDGYNRLYRNAGAGGFVTVTNDPLVKEYDVHWGDAAWADYNNDGALDVFLTTARASVGLPGFGPVALFRNDGAGHFTKMTTNDVGLLAAERTDTYVCCWGDYDNDGWLDLYISANSTIATGQTRTDLLYHNNGDGTFTKVTRGSPVNELGASFGGWLVDVNRDGFLDLVTLQALAPDIGSVRYYRNNGNSNAWLCVQCVGTASPRSATGTKVRVKATIRGKSMWQLRVIDPGGFANAQNFTVHFGLGDATNVDVLRIEWTSGRVQELYDVPVRQYLTVPEPVTPSMPQPGELHIQCWKGMTYRIESSTNLLTWESRATVTSTNLSGGAGWIDSEIPGGTARFYRAVKQ